MPVVVEDVDLHRAAEELGYIKPGSGGQERRLHAGQRVGEVLQDSGGLRQDNGRTLQGRRVQGRAQQLAARRLIAREHVDAVIAYDYRLDTVGELRDLRPLAIRTAQEMFVLGAIAILHRCQNVLAVLAGAQHGLSNAREILANGVGILGGLGAQLVKVNLLVEV